MTKRIKPRSIGLEASSICQLRCPSCPNTNKAILPVLGSGFLKLNHFQKLLTENPWISKIELANYGEIFLNPDLLEIVKYAYRQNVLLTANGVNLNDVKENILEGLVRYSFYRMTCSIDGATSHSYKLYRVGGNFDAVIKNIKKINQFKIKYHSKFPILTWQFIIFGHNEHEIPLARMIARNLGMGFRLKLNWDDSFSPIRNQEFVRKKVGIKVCSRKEYKQKYGFDYMHNICYELWDKPKINWDGKVLGCCRNYWMDFGGNVFSNGLLESLNNERVEYARHMHLGERPPRADIPCSTCDIYVTRKRNNKWLKKNKVLTRKFAKNTLAQLIRYRRKIRLIR